MSEEEFWSIISNARNKSTNSEELALHVTRTLEKQSIDSILGFDYWFSKFHYGSCTSDLWCTAYVAMRGCTEDAFDYFRAWIIGQGKEVFEAALKEPDTLVAVLDSAGADRLENEALLVAAPRAYEAKTGKGIKVFYEVLDQYETDFGSFAQLELNWSKQDEESMRRICPKVFERFW
jgi:hypothetical protein